LVEERLLSDLALMNLSITQPKEAKMAGIPSFLARGALSSAVAIGVAIASAGFAHAGIIYDATGGAPAFEGGDVIDPNAPGGVVGALSRLASKGSLAALDWFANLLTLLKPAPVKG
jgi:hypothetical protein